MFILQIFLLPTSCFGTSVNQVPFICIYLSAKCDRTSFHQWANRGECFLWCSNTTDALSMLDQWSVGDDHCREWKIECDINLDLWILFDKCYPYLWSWVGYSLCRWMWKILSTKKKSRRPRRRWGFCWTMDPFFQTFERDHEDHGFEWFCALVHVVCLVHYCDDGHRADPSHCIESNADDGISLFLVSWAFNLLPLLSSLAKLLSTQILQCWFFSSFATRLLQSINVS